MTIRSQIVLCLAVLLAFPVTSPAGVIFVKFDATGAKDGTSWTDAYSNLQTALAAATTLDEIWVAAGAYTPTDSSDRTATFQLINGVPLYGGFAGTETFKYQRDWTTNETVLSGAIGGLQNEDNSYHVVTGSGTDATTILDGLTITAGAANDTTQPFTTEHRQGGGLLIINGSPTIANVVIRDNLVMGRGGGVLLDQGGTPSFTNVTISNNISGGTYLGVHHYGIGGGMYAKNGHPTFTNVSFTRNYSRGQVAGLLCNGSGTLIGCTFEQNQGDALKFSLTGTALVDSCTFVDNDGMGAFSGLSTSLTLRNTVFDGNQGGGAYVTNGVVENVTFVNNSGVSEGGLRIYGDVTVANAVFINNTGTNSGGVYIVDGDAVLTNVSFFGNTTRTGGTIRVSSGAQQIHNAIIWGNFIWGNVAPAVVIEAGASVTFSHSLVEGSGGSAAWNTAFGIDGGNNIDADPLYADDSTLDLRLSAGSPAINAGDNNAPNLPTTDLDGKSRVAEGVVDMGGYEFECPAGTRLYVDANAIKTGSGLSWNDPFKTLQQALVAACSTVTEIWVAVGTYVPTASADRARTFKLRNGLTIYGGFAGTEAAFRFRNLAANPTVLSGEIASPAQTDNSYHVVTGSGVDSTAVLDGFVITGGYADGTAPDDNGGGMINLTGSPTVRNVRFENNVALASGGGMYNFINSRPRVVNTVFWKNWGVSSGGGVHNALSYPFFTNVTLHDNVSMAGGGIHNIASDPLLVNTIMSGNDNGEIVNVSSNPLISHSLVEGSGGSDNWNPAFGADGGNNVDADPLFTEGDNGDLTLGTGSPAINAGDNGAPDLPAEDIVGRPRIIDITVDMGAHESGVAIGAGEDLTQDLPRNAILATACPNPFNPSITIRFEMDRARRVQLSVFDVRGKLVRRLVNGLRGPGRHETVWDGSDAAGRPVASGVYIVQFITDGRSDHRKIVLIK